MQPAAHDSLTQHASSIRRNILSLIYQAGSGHPGGSLGSVEIFTALYFKILQHKPEQPQWPDRDWFLLSAGHICPALYATLAEAGYFPTSELKNLRQLHSLLQGHPHFEAGRSLPGIENSSGPLGQGLSQAIGVALAMKMDHKTNRVYTLLSDGEQDEGQTMEALMFAGSKKLDNLTMLIDRNGSQLSGNTIDILPLEPLARRIRHFGWQVIEVDGHNMAQISTACEQAKQTKYRPTAIICHTVLGKGVSFMENNFNWHGKAPNQKQYEQALEELG